MLRKIQIEKRSLSQEACRLRGNNWGKRSLTRAVADKSTNTKDERTEERNSRVSAILPNFFLYFHPGTIIYKWQTILPSLIPISTCTARFKMDLMGIYSLEIWKPQSFFRSAIIKPFSCVLMVRRERLSFAKFFSTGRITEYIHFLEHSAASRFRSSLICFRVVLRRFFCSVSSLSNYWKEYVRGDNLLFSVFCLSNENRCAVKINIFNSDI